jgi:hypothetical protein
MSWDALTAISTAFTGVVIAVTAIVGVIQLRQIREQRRDAGTIELVRSFQDADFTNAVHLVLALPRNVSAAELREKGHEYQSAVDTIGMRFESLGLLVYRGVVSFDVTEELIGGGVVSAWERLEATIRERRDALDYPMWMEWFQWLAEQFQTRDRMHQAPAHERLRGWRP